MSVDCDVQTLLTDFLNVTEATTEAMNCEPLVNWLQARDRTGSDNPAINPGSDHSLKVVGVVTSRLALKMVMVNDNCDRQ